jgi:spore coat protein H
LLIALSDGSNYNKISNFNSLGINTDACTMKLKIALFLFLLSGNLRGQNINPGVDDIFIPTEVAVIKLTLSSEDKAFLLDDANVMSEVYLPASFYMLNSKMDTLLVNQVGIRLRGNTSRYQQKKGFKIDFREFGGGKFFGYKKFNLKPNVNDPTLVREPITLLLYREMNLPAARTHPVKVFMNEEYMGIYMNIEQLDDEFINMRFGHKGGYLYKCGYGANLVNNGQVFDTYMFESEINKSTDTRAQLNNFVQVLNATSDANFQTEIEKVFNVERYLKQLAIEALLGHWDGYSYNKNNFYLYYNSVTALVEFIPYDADNTWGIDWVDRDWGTRNLNAWYKTDDPRPLTKRILNVPAYKEKYIQNLKLLVKHYFNEEYVYPIVNAFKELVDDAVASDTYYPLAFGFTHATYLNSFTSKVTNSHVDYGIKEYLAARTLSASEQIPNLITAVDEQMISNTTYPNPSASPIFYYTTTSTSPIQFSVYTSTGNPVEVSVEKHTKDTYLISLPLHSAKGFYLIRANQHTVRWILK